MEKTLLSIGHGFSARALAAQLVPQGWRIVGTTRSPDKADAIADTGVEPVVWPGADLGALITQFPNVLVSAGPDSAGDPVLNAVEDAVTRAAPDLRWVGYLSTTGVYGDHDGDWVDEDTPLTPSTNRRC